MTGKESASPRCSRIPGKRDNSSRIVVGRRSRPSSSWRRRGTCWRADVRWPTRNSAVRAQAEVVRPGPGRPRTDRGGFPGDVRRGKGIAGRCPAWAGAVPEDAGDASDAGKPAARPLLPPEYPLGRSRRKSRFHRSKPLAEFRRTSPRTNCGRIYLEDRPAAQGLQAKIRKGDLLVAQAEYEGKPDSRSRPPTCSGKTPPDGMKRSNMVSAMVSMTLPVWRKGKVEPGIGRWPRRRRWRSVTRNPG